METASIYAAEISGRGVENEDQLTSRVFGALEILPKESVLLPFVKQLASDQNTGKAADYPELSKIAEMQDKDVAHATIELWKHIPNRCPDVCITTPSIFIVIEVKQNSAPYMAQLVNQYRQAYEKAKSNKNKTLAYFLLTKHSQEPPEVEEEVKKSEEELKLKYKLQDARIYWRSWFKVPRWLEEITNTKHLEEVPAKLIRATITLLEEYENMREPRIKECFDKSLSESLEKLEKLTTEIRLTFRRVNEKIPEYGFEELARYPQSNRREWFNYNDEKPKDCWIPKSFEFYYKHENWREVKEAWTDPSLYISFELIKNFEGIKVGLWWDEAPKNLVIEVGKKLRLKGSKTKGLKLEERHLDEGHLDVYQDVNLDSLDDGKVVDILVRKLKEMREFAEGLQTLREELGLK